jgi:hypothetical protein
MVERNLLEYEHPCLEKPQDYIDLSGNGADVVRLDENTVLVTMPNGGYVVLTSIQPIEAFCVAESPRYRERR